MSNPACSPAPKDSIRFWSRAVGDCVCPQTPGASCSVSSQALDMRRKAEIFKYKGNSAQLTKKQKLAQMVKGNGPNGKKVWATQSETYTNPNIKGLPQSGQPPVSPADLSVPPYSLVCPGTTINCAPTSNNDTPGPQMLICMDKNVPLTRYKVQRTYAAGNTKWPQYGWAPGMNGFPVGKAGTSMVFS